MKILLALLLLSTPFNLSASDQFTKHINKLNDSPSVTSAREAVDNSRYCYRSFHVVYKNGEVITGTPLLPIPFNDNSNVLKDAIEIIKRECF